MPPGLRYRLVYLELVIHDRERLREPVTVRLSAMLHS